MKNLMAAATIAVAITLAPAGAYAGERILDGAMGAGAGLLAFGPVGAIAGGVIGYTAGPNISRSMGFHHRRYHHEANRDQDNGDGGR